MKDERELDMLGSRRRNFERGDSMWEHSEAGRKNVAHSGNWGKIPVTEGSSRGGWMGHGSQGLVGQGKVFGF